MHIRKILILVVLFTVGVFSPDRIFGQRQTSGSFISVKQEVDLSIDNLQKNIRAEKILSKKFAHIQKFLDETEKTRKRAPRQEEGDEVFLNMLETSLQALPTEKEFKKANCADYRKKMIAEIHPNQNEADPVYLKKALIVLKALCGQK